MSIEDIRGRRRVRIHLNSTGSRFGGESDLLSVEFVQAEPNTELEITEDINEGDLSEDQFHCADSAQTEFPAV